MRLKSQRLNVISLSYLWFVCGFCYYGLVMNLEQLGGNIFLNGIVTFISEISSELLSGFIADHFGRVMVFKIFGLLGGVSFIKWDLLSERNSIKIIFVFLASFGFSGIYKLVYIYSLEVFPTSIRSTAIEFVFLISWLVAILVPSVTPYIPHSSTVIGIISLISVYVDSYLNQTLGLEASDDIPEAKRQSSFLTSASPMIKSIVSKS